MSCPLRLSLIAPAWNERASVDEFVAEADAALAALPVSFELICVDDGSTDGTDLRLRELVRDFPRLHPLRLERHSGKSAAICAGIDHARGELIGFIDADLQNDPKDFRVLLAALEGSDGSCDPDLVNGRRRHREDSWLRLASSVVGNRVRAALNGGPLEDSGSGIKLARAEALRGLPRFEGMHRFLPTLVRMNGGVVVEVDVSHRPRRHGSSRYGLGLARAAVTWLDVLGVRWLSSRRVGVRVEELHAPKEGCPNTVRR
jgi:dolichol-phosphate mannosyltransferase